MFKVEGIYFLQNEKLKMVGCEVLADIEIPNSVLFSSCNPEIEYFFLQEMLSERSKLPFVNSLELFWTVNLSPITICKYERNIVNLPQNMLIEITEKGEYSEEHIEVLQQYREKILIDDFGTGHSNMEIVGKIKPYGLKIDTKMLKLSTDYLKVLINELKKYVEIIIAEKVETMLQFEMMRQIGIDYYQGLLMPTLLQKQNVRTQKPCKYHKNLSIDRTY